MMKESALYPIGCIIMASGSALRFGSNKLLTSFNGRPLIQHILDITDGLFAARVVVTRYEKIAAICKRQNIPYILHNKPYLNDTVRLGMAYIEPQDPLGYIFCTSDQPFLQRVSLRRLCDSFLSAPYAIERLAYGSSPGNPMLFPQDLSEELKTLPQDRGGSAVAKKYPERVRLVQVQDKYELFDIDTVRDLRQGLNLAAAKRSEQ